jgi:single-stranded-DNA-specific exonuclease
MDSISASDWPVPPTVLEQGRSFMRSAATAKNVVVACDKDVDGLTSGLIVFRALEQGGAKKIQIIPARKGEHAHSESMRMRLAECQPDALIVTDMGARGGDILPGVPTLIIDHHQPKGYPPGATIVSAAQATPVPCSSVLAYILVEPLCDAAELKWLAMLGAIADLAEDVPYPDIAAIKKQSGSKNVSETIALLNAARRSSRDEVLTALSVLKNAHSCAEIAKGDSAEIESLRECRREVSSELKKFFRLAPKFSKTQKVAMLRFSSPTQIHPLIATRWAGTLGKYAVLAANDGYIPGRVIFSLRTSSDINLIELLMAAAPELKDEFGYGHRQATAGNLSAAAFEQLLQGLGFVSA